MLEIVSLSMERSEQDIPGLELLKVKTPNIYGFMKHGYLKTVTETIQLSEV